MFFQVKLHVSSLWTTNKAFKVYFYYKDNQLDVIRALFFNFLKGVIPINTDNTKTLLPFEKTIHLLADKTVGRVEKRILVTRKQSLLSSFLKTVLPIKRL